MRQNICKNRQGILELPMQYVIAVIVAGIAIFLMSAAAYTLWKENEMKKAVREVKQIVNEAELMYITGEEGTRITIDVNLPNSVKRVVFGSSDENLANHYYTLMRWGTNKSFFAEHVKFKGKESTKAVLHGGSSRIVLEIERVNGGSEKYVKIYPSQ